MPDLKKNVDYSIVNSFKHLLITDVIQDTNLLIFTFMFKQIHQNSLTTFECNKCVALSDTKNEPHFISDNYSVE